MSVSEPGPTPPVARVDEVVETHWGVEVKDPYRYLENDADPEVLAWFRGQAAYAEGVLAALPDRRALFERLLELDRGAPFRTSAVKELDNGDVFYLRREAGDNIEKLYHQPAGGVEARVLVDPQTLGAAGEAHHALAVYQPSWDGRHLVYGIAQGGSEETTYHILEIATGRALDAPIGRIETAYNRPQWALDGSGFYYSRRRDLPDDAPATEIYKQTAVRFHRLGTDPADDPVIAAFGVADSLALLEADFPSIVITPGSDYAVLKVKHGDNNELSLFSAPRAALNSAAIDWRRISREADLISDFAVAGNDLYLLSAQGAPRFKVLRISLLEPDIATAEVVIAGGDAVLERVVAARDALYINAREDGINRVLRKAPGADLQRLATPRDGSAYIAAASPALRGLRVYESSWIQGGIRYRFDPDTEHFTDDGLLPRGAFDAMEGFVAREVRVASHDGVEVPLSLLHRADIELDGRNPSIVYGYGAYGVSMEVTFSPLRMAWLERGGVYAIAHVRGGGEYGQQWHYAGRMASKPNTWLDLIACAEYLAREGYASAEHLAPMGASAGGVLAGRAITARPELFGAAVVQVGMLDAIRAETTSNGVPNIKEFGTVTDRAGFEGLLAMSSYHQVRDGVRYPPTLLTHGYNDPRVNPWMSGKMAARLQAAGAGEPPVLLRVAFDSGHGIGSTREQVLSQYADIYAFLLAHLGGKQAPPGG